MVKRAGGALLAMLRVEPEPGRTLGVQLTLELRQAILEGLLRPGDRLPATRVLAAELGVARSTVVEAFEQLAAEGLIETRVGSGTFVAALPAVREPVPAEARLDLLRAAPPEWMARLMATATRQFTQRLGHSPRAFTTAMPALDKFPMAQWSRMVARCWQSGREETMGYGDPLGYAPLRQAIARHLRGNRGLKCDPAQVFVVNGAQQAFQLIATILADPGSTVWFENPGAIGARNCFVIHGAKLVPVPVDDHGICVAEGLARAPDFRLAFVTPSHQQPLGVRMSHERRIELLQAAAQAGAFVIEDDWDGDLTLTGRPTAALKSLDAGERVIYVGSFSKTMFPALRIGFLVSPPSYVPIFEMALRAYSSGAPTSSQAALAAFIDGGHYAAHIRRMRRLYAERQAVLLAEAAAHLAPWLRLTETATGMDVRATLAPGLDSEAVAQAAAAEGVTATPIRRFRLDPGVGRGPEELVLGFAGVPAARLVEGVQGLVRAFRLLDP